MTVSSADYLDKDVSLFKGSFATVPAETIKLGTFFAEIVEESGIVNTYRQLVSKYGKKHDKAASIKKSLQCITPSGVFETRTDAGLKGEFTNVIVLDLDRKGNEGINLDDAVKESEYLESTLAYHKSVSDDGYAIYVIVDKWTANTYRYAMQHYSIMMGVELDKATSNLSRLRYISSDANIYIAEIVSPLIIPQPVKQKPKEVDYTTNDDSDEGIYKLIDDVISAGNDPTENYDDWITLGCAIANWLGESGRGLFHKVSGNYHSYDYHNVDKKYSNLLSMGSYKSTKGSIVYLLNKYR